MGNSATIQNPQRVRLYRAPLVWPAIFCLAGIVAGRYVPLPTGLWAVLAAAGLVTAITTFRRPHLRTVTVLAILACAAGLAAVHVRQAYFSIADDHVVTYTDRFASLSTLRGRIVTSPVVAEDEPNPWAGYTRPPRMSFILDAGQIKTSPHGHPGPADEQATSGPPVPHAGKMPAAPSAAPPAAQADSWTSVSGLVRVTLREPNYSLAAGQEVELLGWIGRVRGADNPGQLDGEQTGRLNRTLVWMNVKTADGAIVLASADGPASRAWWNIRSSLRQHLCECGDEEDGRLINALISGQRHPALASLNQSMVKAGVAHFLSISGQHLAIFLGFMYMLCRVTSIRPSISAGIVLGILVVYMLLAEPSPPLLRSAIMAGLLCLATIFSRQYSPLNAIAAAAIILLAMDPLQAFSAGFQLSFLIVTGMIVLHHPLKDALFGRWLKRRGLVVFRDRDRIRRWLNYSLANWGILIITASVSAYLVSLPLAAYHFGVFSPYAAPLSILLAPLLTAVLVPAYISAALAWPMPNLSAAIGNLSAGAADWLKHAVELTAHLPGLSMELRPVPVWWVLLFFGGVAVFLLRRRLPLAPAESKIARRAAVGVAAAIVAAAAGLTQREAPAPASLEMSVLAVGDGQCVVIRTPGGKTFLVDAGTRSSLNVSQQVLLPFIRNERLARPDVAFISHANTDHYNALPGMILTCRPSSVYTCEYFPPDPRPRQKGTGTANDAEPVPFSPDIAAARSFLQHIRRQQAKVEPVSAGQKIQIDDRTCVEVLWPLARSSPAASHPALTDVNDTSLVLKITCDGHSILLPGDIDEPAQRLLVASGQDLRADVLILPHHGSYRPTLEGLVRAVSPRVVISSSSDEIRYPARHRAAAERFFASLKADRYSTSRSGCIAVSFSEGKVNIETAR